jgi:hypothetical protein
MKSPACALGLVLVIAFHSACSRSSDQFMPMSSPNGRMSLTPSLHEGTLVQLTVRSSTNGNIVDQAFTRDTDQMKWVSGWIDDKSYLFWGADTGTTWVRTFDGSAWVQKDMSTTACRTLERLFEAKYGERRGNCLLPEVK